MSSNSDIYLRITYPDYTFVQAHRTWDADFTLRYVRAQNPKAEVRIISYDDYLKEIKQ